MANILDIGSSFGNSHWIFYNIIDGSLQDLEVDILFVSYGTRAKCYYIYLDSQ